MRLIPHKRPKVQCFDPSIPSLPGAVRCMNITEKNDSWLLHVTEYNLLQHPVPNRSLRSRNSQRTNTLRFLSASVKMGKRTDHNFPFSIFPSAFTSYFFFRRFSSFQLLSYALITPSFRLVSCSGKIALFS